MSPPSSSTSSSPSFTIRRAQTGDLGWIFERQAVLYAKEHDYSPEFERHLAAGLAPYLAHHDPERDRLWIAEHDHMRAGAIAIHHTDERPGWAKLRWFFVEPHARGHGLGTRLLEQAITFSRATGYAGILLWTVNDLADARRLYERAGFVLKHEDEAPCAWAPWGHEQCWERAFAPGQRPGADRPASRASTQSRRSLPQ